MHKLKSPVIRCILLFVFINLFLLKLSAENADTCFYVQADLATRWVWRGVAYSEAPVIQPSLGYSSGKLDLTIWGSYPIERRAYSEIDFMFEYRFTPRFSLGFVDYFAINDSVGAKHDFFNMKQETTWHMLDIYGVCQPLEKVPVSLLYSLWFWGADRDPDGKQNMSSYVEAKYQKQVGRATASLFAGMTLGEGFYASRAAIVNMGVGLSSPITLGGLASIPVKMEFVLNPYLQNAYINAIFTIK
jgi:hypothetical protein